MFIAKKFVVMLAAMPLFFAALAHADIPPKPIVIAHRGASGYRPEHTLASYELAINMGADFVEPDLVSTKDGELVARHENEISTTTNVAEHREFACRRKTKKIDGQDMTGWFTEDFTLAELKTLRARERMPNIRQRNTIYNDHYSIPTFQEIIDLVKRKNSELNRIIGIYPEVKHPSYFASIGLATENHILEVLARNGYKDKSSPVFIQCFEPATLKKLHKLTDIPLILLVEEEGKPYDFVLANDPRTYADIMKPSGLEDLATYAQGIGPHKNLIAPRDKSGRLTSTTNLIADAHKVGLQVHPWTFRNENSFLPLDYRSGKESGQTSESAYGDPFAEYKMFYELGVDGVFSENPDTALEARTRMSH